MKKSIILQMIAILIPLLAMTQSTLINQKVHDAKSGKDILIGYCTLDSLQGSLFKEYFTGGYTAYKPAEVVMKDLMERRDQLRSIHVTIVMGTWCSDSQEQVPRFYKILDNLPHVANTTIICVDRQKLAGDVSLEGMNIVKVPTFIFNRNEAEIGRIIETPQKSLEQDLLDIISK